MLMCSTIAAFGLNAVCIAVLGQADDPTEAAGEPFVTMQGSLALAVARDWRALATQGEDAALESHVDFRGVDTGYESVDLGSGGRGADVHGGKARRVAADTGRAEVERLPHLSLQSIHFGE